MPADAPASPKEMLLQMWRIRKFELRALELFQERLIRGSVHPYIGMEAIAVGACAALGPDDYVTSTHRGHGHCIARGLDLGRMMAELLGRRDGYCRGKGGSMHITAMDEGMLGADGVVAGSVAIAVGAAHALRLAGKESVVVTFFGDGAINQGLFHEAANLAAVLRASVVFVCENNEWALSTHVAATVPISNLADRANAYGFPGMTVDGNDVVAVRDAALEAVEHARSGRGPVLLEAKSYRITPHSAATPTELRPEAELDEWRRNDPILRCSARIAEEVGADRSQLAEIEERAAQEVEEAVEYALASPSPEPGEEVEDVYAPSSWNKRARLA
jgi:TPP-dependent pyruvate/acetoin dehydrogenase alpha subunit